MKKIIIFIGVFLFAYKEIPATLINIKKLQKENIPIIDIRTSQEWKMTGTIPGAKKLSFILPNGRINPLFFKKLPKNEEFAIICRTGHRSKFVSEILDKEGYKVINLKGGMFALFKDMLNKMGTSSKK